MQEKRHDRVVEMRLCFFSGKAGDYKMLFAAIRKCCSTAERRMLVRALNKLSSREKLIVRMRFGLDNPEGREKTQKEVADILGISQSYISRLEKKIMQRLKREMVRYEQ